MTKGSRDGLPFFVGTIWLYSSAVMTCKAVGEAVIDLIVAVRAYSTKDWWLSTPLLTVKLQL